MNPSMLPSDLVRSQPTQKRAWSKPQIFCMDTRKTEGGAVTKKFSETNGVNSCTKTRVGSINTCVAT